MDLSSDEDSFRNFDVGSIVDENEEISVDIPQMNRKMPNLNTEETDNQQSQSSLEDNQYLIEGKKLQELLKQYFGEKIKITCTLETSSDDLVQVIATFALEKYFDEILVLSQIKIIPQQSKLELYSVLCRFDGNPYIIGEKVLYNSNSMKLQYLRLLLARYFIRINRSFRYGCFSIDPQHGIIKLKMTSVLNNLTFHSLAQQTEIQNQYFISQLLDFVNQTSHFIISFYIFYILHLSNKQTAKALKQIKKKLEKHHRTVANESQMLLQNMFDILNNKYNKELSSEEQIKYKTYLSFPQIQQNEIEQDMKIISKINIASSKYEIEKQLVEENQKGTGGFSKIYQIKAKFLVQNDREINRYIVLKKSLNSQNEKSIDHEKKILEHLAKAKEQINGECVFLQKFYYSEQDDFKQYLFMELCIHGGLNKFCKKFQATQGLSTKLFILYQICMGLRYLRLNKVQHIDLKPSNILVTRNFIVKITDFGESFCLDESVMNEQYLRNYQPGFTFPYTAPELTQNVYNDKVDIFSFGMLMSEYIFNEYPLDFLKTNLDLLKQQYREKSYQIKLNESYVKQLGPKHLMKILRILIILCLQPEDESQQETQSRPKLEWIIVILREALSYIEKMY